jgi:transposase-like protein
VAAQFRRGGYRPGGQAPDAADGLGAAREDRLAFSAVPREIWRQVWSSNPQERQSCQRCRTDVVGIFPARDAIIRLVGALMEQNDEWTEARSHMGLDVLAKMTTRTGSPAEEVNATEAIRA